VETRYDDLLRRLREASRPAGVSDEAFDVPPHESFLARADTVLAEGYTLYGD
jgi:hypothetical protein